MTVADIPGKLGIPSERSKMMLPDITKQGPQSQTELCSIQALTEMVLDSAFGDTCATMEIFQDPSASSAIATNFFCWSEWPAPTVYREWPSPTGTSSSSASETEVNGPQKTPSPGTPVRAPGAEPTKPSNEDENKEESGSNAWIAGAIIGPIAGLALVGIFWFVYRQRQQKATRGVSVGSMDAGPDAGRGIGGVGGAGAIGSYGPAAGGYTPAPGGYAPTLGAGGPYQHPPPQEYKYVASQEDLGYYGKSDKVAELPVEHGGTSVKYGGVDYGTQGVLHEMPDNGRQRM
ncbi:hypothetical protein AJ79_01767 [Helicocarpus griseus UAMH5409]|uniref:Uncharacterized protein n=1 Tax=Helicocarpus griseus UAMH5409 TaxID=1447875 RepID=A0A2B7Y4L7_9EURO|nr:hypothetical protein AJ79_01767 [Helicocarpus griseus UAMH5409]